MLVTRVRLLPPRLGYSRHARHQRDKEAARADGQRNVHQAAIDRHHKVSDGIRRLLAWMPMQKKKPNRIAGLLAFFPR